MKKVDNRIRDFVLLLVLGIMLLIPAFDAAFQIRSQTKVQRNSTALFTLLWQNHAAEIIAGIVMLIAAIAVIFRKKN